VISPKPFPRSKNQIKLGCLKIPSPSLEDFSCLHPPIEGFQKKTIPIPNPWYFTYTTSLGSKALWQSKSQPRKNPVTPWLSRNGKVRIKTLLKLDKTNVNDSKITKYTHTHTMHAKFQLGNHTCNLLPTIIPAKDV